MQGGVQCPNGRRNCSPNGREVLHGSGPGMAAQGSARRRAGLREAAQGSARPGRARADDRLSKIPGSRGGARGRDPARGRRLSDPDQPAPAVADAMSGGDEATGGGSTATHAGDVATAAGGAATLAGDAATAAGGAATLAGDAATLTGGLTARGKAMTGMNGRRPSEAADAALVQALLVVTDAQGHQVRRVIATLLRAERDVVLVQPAARRASGRLAAPPVPLED